MNRAVIVSGCRTAVGAFGGALKDVSAVRLGATVLREALQKVGNDLEDKEMTELAIQDHYADEFAHCYGCGRLNEDGLQIKSYLDGDETVCRFTPGHKHSGGFPGFLYGGMIASLMDCHGAATAWEAKARTEQKTMTRFVTASLKIDFRAPAPTNIEVEIRGKVNEIKGRKVVVDLTLSADGKLCAEGSAVMVQIPCSKQED